MVWRCTHPRSKFVPPPDYVTGKPVTPRQLRCYDARFFDDGSTCGPQGPLLGGAIDLRTGQLEWLSVCSFGMLSFEADRDYRHHGRGAGLLSNAQLEEEQ
jgi:hypothetical protein